MFDVGFWEFLLIGVVALLVVGPERLPGLARTVGTWVGKVRRFVASVKADIDREVRAEELQQLLNKQNEFRKDIYEIVEDTRQSVEDTRKGIEQTAAELNQLGRDQDATSPGTDKSRAEPHEPAKSDGETKSA